MNSFHVFTGQIHGRLLHNWGRNRNNGGGFFIGGRIIHLLEENFPRVRNRRERHLRVKIRPWGGFPPGKLRRPSKI